MVFGTGRGLVGVPTLNALIERARKESSVVTPGDTIIAALPARRGEYFLAREGNDDVQIRRTGQVIEEGGRDHVVLTGDLSHLTVAPGQRCVEPPIRRCSAAWIGFLGERMLREGRRDDVGKLEPHYALEFFLNADMTERT